MGGTTPSTPASRAAAADAWFMGTERNARPMTPSERQKARSEAAYQRWSEVERWLVTVAPAWIMPAGNACPFAVEGALWLLRKKPDLKKGDAFLNAVQDYRNERLDRLGEMDDFKTTSWLDAPWTGDPA